MKITPKHIDVIYTYLNTKGNKRLTAERCNIHPGTLSRWLRAPEFKEELEKVQNRAYSGVEKGMSDEKMQIRDQMEIDKKESYKVLMEIMRDSNSKDEVRAKIAKDILTETNVFKGERAKVPVVPIKIDADKANILIQTAKEVDESKRLTGTTEELTEGEEMEKTVH